MSIALEARVAELERRLAEVEERAAQARELAERARNEQIIARKPGPKPKESNG